MEDVLGELLAAFQRLEVEDVLGELLAAFQRLEVDKGGDVLTVLLA